MEETNYKTADLWSGLALAGLGVYIVVQAWQWEYLGPDGPGPGFFPLWYGAAMLLASGALVASSVLRRDGTRRAAIEWRRTGRALAVWLALAVSVALCKLLGFVVSFALLALFIVVVMYRRPLRVGLGVAVASAGSFYLVFALGLGVPLPVGLLGF